MTTIKKYELTNETKIANIYGLQLHRIKALEDFNDVKVGDLGGWIEKESNLAQQGDCWVYDEAEVYDSARVSGNACVCDEAWVSGNACVCDEACVCGDACVCDEACVCGDAFVRSGRIRDRATICGNARIFDVGYVVDNATIGGNARVDDPRASIGKNAYVTKGVMYASLPAKGRKIEITFYENEAGDISHYFVSGDDADGDDDEGFKSEAAFAALKQVAETLLSRTLLSSDKEG